jgi:preprotein translocase subunit YajC
LSPAFILLQADSGGSSLTGLLVTFVPIILIFYVLVYMPNQRQQKRQRELLANLKNGDRVVTSGGVHGTIVGLRDEYIVLRVPPDSVKLEVQRSSVAGLERPEDQA